MKTLNIVEMQEVNGGGFWTRVATSFKKSSDKKKKEKKEKRKEEDC